MKVSRTVQTVHVTGVWDPEKEPMVSKGKRTCAVQSVEVAYGWASLARNVRVTVRGYEASYYGGYPTGRACRLDLDIVTDDLPDWLIEIVEANQPLEWQS